MYSKNVRCSTVSALRLMKVIVFLLICIATAQAQWISGGGNTTTSDAVGVGTTSPTSWAAFTVRTSASVNGKNVSASVSDGIHSTFDIRHPVNNVVDLSAQNSALTFSTTSAISTDGIERMRIDTAGNVGIGTTNPSAYGKFAIRGGATESVTGSNLTGVSFETSDAVNSSLFINHTSGLVNLVSDSALSFYTSVTEKMRITTAGNVGIGTASPRANFRLDVAGASSFGQGTEKVNISGGRLSFNRDQFSGAMTDPTKGGADIYTTSAGELTFETFNASGTLVNTALVIKNNGDITAAGTVEAGNIHAKYQDVAEWVPASEQLLAGTVVVLDATKSNQVTSSTVSYDTRVAGVVSEQPGLALGEKSEGKVLVATTGRVRVQVDASKGPIHIGDLLVTSDVPGLAMKSEPIMIGRRQIHAPGTLIGKALEPLEKGKGAILVLLSLQ